MERRKSECSGVAIIKTEKLGGGQKVNADKAREETRLEVGRFKAARLRLGHNKAAASIAIGEVVLIQLDQHSQLGVVTQLSERDVTVRLKSGREVHTSVGNCASITQDMESANGEKTRSSEFRRLHTFCLY